jgi:hypothetical protein
MLIPQTSFVSDYPAIESRGYRDCTEDCYNKYLNWNIYQTLCLMKCSAFNRKIEVNVDLFENPVAEMEGQLQIINSIMLFSIFKINYDFYYGVHIHIIQNLNL